MNIHYIRVTHSVFWAICNNNINFVFVNENEFDEKDMIKEKDIIILHNKRQITEDHICWTARTVKSYGRYEYLPEGFIIVMLDDYRKENCEPDE